MSKNIVIDKSPIKDIPTKSSVKQKQMTFSFELFDRTSVADFNLGGVKPDWFVSLLDELKYISEKTELAFRQNPKWDLHGWSETSKRKYSFSSEKYGPDIEELQFRLDKSHGRVNGFIVDSVFYVVWLDPFHKMTNSDGYGEKNSYPPQKTSYEEAMDIIKEQSEKIRKLETDVDSLLLK